MADGCPTCDRLALTMMHLLRHRAFRLLLGARLLGQSGDGLLQGGLVGYSLFSPEKQATASGIATGFALLLLPYSLIGPFVGVLIDRVPRRRVIVLGNVMRAGFSVAIMLCVWHNASYALLLPLVLAALACNRMVLTAHAAAIACTVNSHERVTANSLAPTIGSGASAIATVLAPALAKLWGDNAAATSKVIVIAGAMWLLASVVISRIGPQVLGPHRGAAPEARNKSAQEIFQGFRVLRDIGSARRAIAIIAVHRMLFGFTLLLTIVHAREHLTQSSRVSAITTVAIVGGLAAGGTFIGAIFAPRLIRGIGPIRGGGLGLGLAGLAIPLGWWFGMNYATIAMYIAAPIIGISYATIRVSSDTVVQSVIADALRGRVFSVYDIVLNVCLVTGVTIAAATVHTRTWALLGAAVLVTAVAVFYGRSARRLSVSERAALALAD